MGDYVMESGIKKRHIIWGIFIIMLIIIFIIILFIHIRNNEINEYYWYEKWNRTMELLGEAMVEQDIELLDELFNPDCEVISYDDRVRKYTGWREVMKEAWDSDDFNIISYYYDDLGWNKRTALCTFEIDIIDTDGNEYEWTAVITLARDGSFEDMDCNITRISSFVHPRPGYY